MDIVEKFFQAYAAHDMYAIQQVMSERVKWSFPGRNPFSGIRTGLPEGLAFFDDMGMVMRSSNTSPERLVDGMNHRYVVECQHVWTNWADHLDLDHRWCVLWEIKGGKIVQGTHFAAEQHLVDEFLERVFPSPPLPQDHNIYSKLLMFRHAFGQN